MKKIKSRILSAMLMLPFVNSCVLSMERFKNYPELQIEGRTEYSFGIAGNALDVRTQPLPSEKEFDAFMEQIIRKIIKLNLKNYRLFGADDISTGYTYDTYKSLVKREEKFANYETRLKDDAYSPIRSEVLACDLDSTFGNVIVTPNKNGGECKIDGSFEYSPLMNNFFFLRSRSSTRLLEKVGYGVCRSWVPWLINGLKKNGVGGMQLLCEKNEKGKFKHCRCLTAYRDNKGNTHFVVADPYCLSNFCVLCIEFFIEQYTFTNDETGKQYKRKPTEDELYTIMKNNYSCCNYGRIINNGLLGYLKCPLSKYMANAELNKGVNIVPGTALAQFGTDTTTPDWTTTITSNVWIRLDYLIKLYPHIVGLPKLNFKYRKMLPSREK